jgi:predicted transcriptional regulator of viral defense system
MNHGSLVKFAGGLECFDLQTLVQGFGESRDTIRVQLSRWMKTGKLIGLRQGMYTLPDHYRRISVTAPSLANQMYRPSYLTGLWALGFYDLIPERVVWLTSVSPRVPRTFENPYGVFIYQWIKQDAFFGSTTVRHAQRDVVVAEPEKALLDHWHLVPGEWTAARLEEMRYQHFDRVAGDRLRSYADRFGSPRLVRAAERWLNLASQERKGTVEL